ncbi:MAG: hypothetical protein IJ344_00115, partial [Clostridia bacterium]|nr:hypothetical protein [Clostridia bacterium]
VLEGNELVEHCQNYFWKVCDKMYLYIKYMLDCTDAEYTHEEKHAMWETLYNIFHMIFTDKDFGFYNDRLVRISFFMALESGKAGQFERAMEELEKLLIYLENYKGFTGISHSSLFVNKIKIGQPNIAKSSEETLGHAYLRYLNNNEAVFSSIKDTPRYLNIKERLSNL